MLSTKGEARNVYDLLVESDHEYYANGLLVHNCMDAIIYLFHQAFKQDYKKLAKV